MRLRFLIALLPHYPRAHALVCDVFMGHGPARRLCTQLPRHWQSSTVAITGWVLGQRHCGFVVCNAATARAAASRRQAFALSLQNAFTRKVNDETCTLPQAAVNRQLSTMTLHHMLDDGQAQARTARVA